MWRDGERSTERAKNQKTEKLGRKKTLCPDPNSAKRQSDRLPTIPCSWDNELYVCVAPVKDNQRLDGDRCLTGPTVTG